RQRHHRCGGKSHGGGADKASEDGGVAVAPAKAGAHTPQRKLLQRLVVDSSSNNHHWWLWAPAFAGAAVPCPPRRPSPIVTHSPERPPAYGGFHSPGLSCKDACRTLSVPIPFRPYQEVSDGQSHAILHRRRLGRSGRQEVHPRRQSGDGRSDV